MASLHIRPLALVTVSYQYQQHITESPDIVTYLLYFMRLTLFPGSPMSENAETFPVYEPYCFCVCVLIFHWKQCQTVLFSFYLNFILNSSGYSCFSQFFKMPHSLQYTTGHYHSPILCLTHLNYPLNSLSGDSLQRLPVIVKLDCPYSIQITGASFMNLQRCQLYQCILQHLITLFLTGTLAVTSGHNISHRVQVIKSAGSHSGRKIETFLIHY